MADRLLFYVAVLFQEIGLDPIQRALSGMWHRLMVVYINLHSYVKLL